MDTSERLESSAQEKEASDRAINLLFLNGTVIRVTGADIWEWLREKQTIYFFSFVVLGFIIQTKLMTDEPKMPQEFWLIGWTVLWAVCFFVFQICAMVFLIIRIAPHFPKLILPLPLCVLGAHVTLQMVLTYVIRDVWGFDYSDTTLLYDRILILYIFVLATELIYTYYLLPKSEVLQRAVIAHLNHVANEPTAGSATPDKQGAFGAANIASAAPINGNPNIVYVGIQKFVLEDILLIQAEEHYVRVYTKNGDTLVRAKISEAAIGLPPSAGIQVHRSYWVSFGTIKSKSKLPNGKLSLELTTGEILTVPRARIKGIETALTRYGIDV